MMRTWDATRCSRMSYCLTAQLYGREPTGSRRADVVESVKQSLLCQQSQASKLKIVRSFVAPLTGPRQHFGSGSFRKHSSCAQSLEVGTLIDHLLSQAAIAFKLGFGEPLIRRRVLWKRRVLQAIVVHIRSLSAGDR
jgi:hypothetical protein